MFTDRIYYQNMDNRFTVSGWNRMDHAIQAVAEVLLHERISPDEDDFKIKFMWDESSCDWMNNDDEYDMVVAYPRNIRNFAEGTSMADKGYVHDTELEAFYKKNYKIKVLIFKKEVTKTCVVVCFKKDITAFHALAAGFPKMMPWYFNDAPLTDEELALLESTQGDDFQTVYNFFKNYADSQTIDVLESIGRSMKKAKIDGVKRQIDDIESQMESCNTRMSELLVRRREYQEKLTGIMNGEEEDAGKVFKDYLLANKNIKLKEVNNTRCRFEIDSFLTNYDEDYAVTLYREIDNGIRRYGNVFSSVRMNDSNWKLFFKAVFLDKKFKLRMRASYSVDIQNFGFSAERMYSIPNDRVPNPHIQDFRCIGDYYGLMNDAMRRGDIPGMLMVAQVSAASVNLLEYPSARNLFNYIYTMKDQKILEDNEGKIYSVIEVIEMEKAAMNIDGADFVANAEVTE